MAIRPVHQLRVSLGFFEAVLWPNFRRSGIKQADIIADLVGVRDALSESGAREVGRSYLLHPCWVFDGVFHPKLTALEGDDLHLLVGSGNLTFGGWGTNTEVVEHLVAKAAPVAFADAAAFIEALATSPRLQIAELNPLIQWSERLGAAGKRAAEGAVRLLHNVERPIGDQLREFAEELGGARKLTVVSPYFGGPSAVLRLAEQLSAEGVEVHVPGHLPYRGEHFPFAKAPFVRPVEVELFASERANQERPLHAKVIEVLCRRGRLLLSGSINASAPALTGVRNVELGVLRIYPGSDQVLRRSPAAVPSAQVEPIPEGESQNRQPVIFANASGDSIRGWVFGPGVAGQWSALLIWSGVTTAIGDTSVSADGSFAINRVDLAMVSYGAGRAKLRLVRGEAAAEGFIAVAENLELGSALGAAAGPMMRTATGVGDEEDLAAVLEWMSMNPDMGLAPWRSGRDDKEERLAANPLVDPHKAVIISDGELGAISGPGVPGGQSAIDRLLARLRAQLRDPPESGGLSGANGQEEPEDPADGAGSDQPSSRTSRDPVISVFDQMWGVLQAQVAKEPGARLRQMAELGACVAVRRQASLDRVGAICADWTALAITHLSVGSEQALLDLARNWVVLAAALDGSVVRARRRLLHLSDGVTETIMAPILLDPLLARLIGATIGSHRFEEVLEQIRSARSPYDELLVIKAAISTHAALPSLGPLESEPEIARARRFMARGKAEMVVLLEGPLAYCPKHFQKLPSSQAYRLAGVGLATPDCCDRVLVNLAP